MDYENGQIDYTNIDFRKTTKGQDPSLFATGSWLEYALDENGLSNYTAISDTS